MKQCLNMNREFVRKILEPLRFQSFLTTNYVVTLGCSGTQNGTSGVITSPGYPNNYASNTNCEWRIVTSPSKVILIQFDDFDVENDNECGYDKLTVQEQVRVSLFSQICTD